MTEPLTPQPSQELDRLADAIDAYLARGSASGASDSAYLARLPHLRDLLEPMLHEESAATEPPPQRVGPYRILGELGRGGMGVVFEAEHEALRRIVAVKVLPSLLSVWPRRVERFLREAAAVASLDHPGIVRVFDAGEADGVFYYAMERVEGGTLRAALETVRARCGGDPRQLPDAPQLGGVAGRGRIAEIAELGALVADALAHAHAQGVVHRDVKPQNLLLGGGGRPRLVDFGLAKDLVDDMSGSCEFAGTPHYASPEQVEPNANGVDGRCDVFALGVVLYELATLRRPFDGASTSAVLRAVVGDEPRPLRAFDSRISRDFEAIVLQALEKAPGSRYASAAAFAADLRRFLRGEAVRARRPSVLRQAWRWVRRKPATATAVLLALVLALGAPSAGLWLTSRSRTAIAAERDVATASLAAAQRSIESLLVRIADEDLPNEPRLQRFRLRLLRDARRGYDELLRIAGPTPTRSLVTHAIRATGAEGSCLYDSGEVMEAHAAFDRSVSLCRHWLASCGADADVEIALASALTSRGLTHFVLHRPELARADFARAREHWCELQAQLPGSDPRHARVLRGIARTEVRYADFVRYHSLPRAQAALARAEAALAAAPAPRRGSDEDHHIDVETAALGAELAAAVGQMEAARSGLGRAEELLRAARLDGVHSMRMSGLHARLLVVRALAAKASEESEQAWRDAIDAWARRCAEFPDWPAQRRSLCAARDGLARLLVRLGRYADAECEAEASLREAAEVASSDGSLESRHRLATALGTAAMATSARGQDLEDADGLFGEAVRMLADLAAECPHDLRFHSELGAALSNHAWTLLARRTDPAVVAPMLERAIAAQCVAVAGAPDNVQYRGYLATHLMILAEAALRGRDAAAARATLEQLPPLLAGDGDRLVTVAAGLVRCAQLGEEGALEGALLALERVGRLGQRDRLRAAAADTRFAPLHDLPRFRTLLGGGGEAGR